MRILICTTLFISHDYHNVYIVKCVTALRWLNAVRKEEIIAE